MIHLIYLKSSGEIIASAFTSQNPELVASNYRDAAYITTDVPIGNFYELSTLYYIDDTTKTLVAK